MRIELLKRLTSYALGATLYATLTSRPPFQADQIVDTMMQVMEREPVSPRTLNPSVSKDLETICLKCLEKDRARRYQSATELAAELQRFLDGRPIIARPVSRSARVLRWCRRQPVTANLDRSGACFTVRWNDRFLRTLPLRRTVVPRAKRNNVGARRRANMMPSKHGGWPRTRRKSPKMKPPRPRPHFANPSGAITST